jgi:hypothetical protein
VITRASTASSCRGRVRVRGRDDRPGRIRTSSSSYSRLRAGRAQLLVFGEHPAAASGPIVTAGCGAGRSGAASGPIVTAGCGAGRSRAAAGPTAAGDHGTGR